MEADNEERLIHLYKFLTPKQQSDLEKYSTMTRLIYAEAFLSHVDLGDRPENKDLEIPMAVQLLRIQERMSQKLDRIEGHTANLPSFFESVFSGVGQMLGEWKGKKK